MKRSVCSRRGMLTFAAVAVALALLPLVLTSNYQQHVINMVGIYAILALGMNLAMGYCGQMNLAQGALYGVGAYTSALTTLKLGIPVWAAIPLSGALAAAIGGLVGLPSMKVRSHYLAIVTIGLGEVINLILINWNSLTQGAMGLMGIPSAAFFGLALDTEESYYYLILIVAILLYLLARAIMASHIGRSFIAIRDDYVAARASGINTGYYQIMAFALSAFYAGVAGSLYAHLISYVSPDSFQFGSTLLIMTMIMIGGLGSLEGSIFGAAVLTVLNEYLRAFQKFQLVIYGAMVLSLVMFLPGGVLSLRDRLGNWWSLRRGEVRKGPVQEEEVRKGEEVGDVS